MTISTDSSGVDIHYAKERRNLYALTALAAFLALGHHVDHIIRGNNVGWPVNKEFNGFTYSLVIYPVILIGLFLYRSGRVGPGFWVFLSGGGALFLAFIHFAPKAIEPPSEIIDLYDSRAVGLLAFGWLLLLIAVLAATSVYEFSLWLRHRKRGSV
jgi:hypothetical protein